MNFEAERRKPIFLVRPRALNEGAGRLIKQAVEGHQAFASGIGDDVMIKVAEARSLPSHALFKVAQLSNRELRDLVVLRLKADPAEKFEFLDGTVFTGEQAAREVTQSTSKGQYFLELEKETLSIVQEAYFEGKF